MLIRKENKACETQLTSAGWAPQQGRFSEACCGTEWLELWMIILCAALCCMVLLKSAAGVPKIRASAGTLLAVRTCRDHWCCGSATTAYDWGWGGYIHYQMCPACFSLFIGFLSERQIGSCLAFAKKATGCCCPSLILVVFQLCCTTVFYHTTHMRGIMWLMVIHVYTVIWLWEIYLLHGLPCLTRLELQSVTASGPGRPLKCTPGPPSCWLEVVVETATLRQTCGQKSEARRRGGEFRRSWHLIWGAWQGGRSRACIGTSMTVLGLEWRKAGSERGRDGIALSDIMHMPAVQGRKHRLSPKCSSPRSQWRKWLFPADLRLNAVKTKPPLAARCPPNSAKPLEPSEAHLL